VLPSAYLGALEAKLVGDRVEFLRREALLDVYGNLEDGLGVLGRQCLNVGAT